jgi:hypothetical protein
MNATKKFAQEIRKKFPPGVNRRWPAMLGNGLGVVDAGDGLVYVRSMGQTLVLPNASVPRVEQPVLIGYAAGDPTTLRVLCAWDVFATPVFTQTIDHHKNHEFPAFDMVWVDLGQIQWLNCLPDTEFVVKVTGGVVLMDGDYVTVDNQTIDVEGDLPATGALYVLIQCDDTGIVDSKPGDPVDARELLTNADIPAADSGYFPLCAVALYDSQVKLQRTKSVNDFVDLRFANITSTGGGGGDAGDITYTPAVATDWDGDADPGDVDNALDQLAERTKDIEGDYISGAITKDPTGFDNPASVVINYDPTTQKVTLTGTWVAYWHGQVIATLTTGWVSAAHTNTAGHIYRLYYDGANFVWSTDTEWTFDVFQIASVNYGATDKYAIRECHGLMNWQAHEGFHDTVGAYRESGGTLDPASYTLASTTAANRRPDVVQTVIHDEDNKTTLLALTSKLYTKIFLTLAGTLNYTVETAEIIAVTGSQPAYNQYTGGAWQQTLMTANTYTCVWLIAVPVTASVGSQKYRYLWVQGQSAGTLAQQQALQPADVNLGTLQAEATEFVYLQKIIINYQSAGGGNWVITSVTNLTGNHWSQVGSPAGAFLADVAVTAPITGNGTLASPVAISAATTGAAGSMSAADKTKLDGIGAGAAGSDGWISATGTWTPRSQAYTNDPAAGNNIELNMTDTSGFLVGDLVKVSSSAGTENAIITVVHDNTHITVAKLWLNHTTTNPLVQLAYSLPVERAYTNDPAAGANIELNMTDTTGFSVGDLVWVMSAAGMEMATITVVHANTHLTVDNLALNHTTVAPLVRMVCQYVYVVDTSVDLSGSIGVKDRIKVTDTTVKYFIVHAIIATRLWLCGGTDYSIVGTAAVTSPSYSHVTNPFGFPASPTKWTIEFSCAADAFVTPPTINVVSNPLGQQIKLPIGVWRTEYLFVIYANTLGTTVVCFCSLSTATNSVSDTDFTDFMALVSAAGTNGWLSVSKNKTLTITTPTIYYMVTWTNQSTQLNIGFNNASAKGFIRAVDAYL